MEADDASLTNLIALLKLATQISRPMLDEVAKPHGLGLNELKVLMSLAGEGEMAAHELAELTALPPMAISRAVLSLSTAGLLVEARDARNRRRKLLSLTSAGYVLWRALRPDVADVAVRLFVSLTAVERRVSAKFVAKLLAQLEAWPTPDVTA